MLLPSDNQDGSLASSSSRSVRNLPRSNSQQEVAIDAKPKSRWSWAKRKMPKAPNFFKRKRSPADESCIFHPHSQSVQNWNILIALLLSVQAVVLPLQLAFASDAMLADFAWLVWFSCWADAVLFLDMVLQCFLQVQSADRSYWIRDSWAIAWRYCKRELIIDMCGLLPLRFLATQLVPLMPSIPGSLTFLPSIGRTNAHCSLSLLGFHKLLRFSRSVRLGRSLQANRFSTLMKLPFRKTRLIKSAIMVAFVCHVMGCLWATLGVCGRGERTWVHFVKTMKGDTADLYSRDNFAALYICSLYWAVFTITGVGYGDIVPVAAIEYIVAGFCMLFSALVWAWVIANIVSAMATMNQATNEHLQTLDCISGLLKESSLELQFVRRLREYFTKIRDLKGYEFIGSVIKNLSPELKLEVVHAVHDIWLTQVWWLNKVPDTSEFIVDLTLRMRTCLHAPNELLSNKQELSVVLRGLCIHGGCLKSKGQVFGEDMLLNNEALRKPFNTLAMTFLHLLVLERPLLNKLVVKYPEAAIAIRRSYVQFAIIRGMLYKADIMKRRKASKENAEKKGASGFAAMDHSRMIKPKGDSEDVTGGGAAARAFDAASTDADRPHTRGEKKRPTFYGTSAPDTAAARRKSLSRSTTTDMAMGASRSTAFTVLGHVPGSTREPPKERSHTAASSAADLLLGAADSYVAESRHDVTGTAGEGIDIKALDALKVSTSKLTTSLRERAINLETAASLLLEMAKRLEDL